MEIKELEKQLKEIREEYVHLSHVEKDLKIELAMLKSDLTELQLEENLLKREIVLELKRAGYSLAEALAYIRKEHEDKAIEGAVEEENLLGISSNLANVVEEAENPEAEEEKKPEKAKKAKKKAKPVEEKLVVEVKPEVKPEQAKEEIKEASEPEVIEVAEAEAEKAEIEEAPTPEPETEESEFDYLAWFYQRGSKGIQKKHNDLHWSFFQFNNKQIITTKR